MMFDYCRISCAVPNVVPADVDNNVKEICECIAKAESLGSAVVLFPELSVTGYTCGDLLFQSSLVNAAKNAVKTIADATSSCDVIAVVGTPVAAARAGEVDDIIMSAEIRQRIAAAVIMLRSKSKNAPVRRHAVMPL